MDATQDSLSGAISRSSMRRYCDGPAKEPVARRACVVLGLLRGLRGFAMGFLRLLESLIGMFQGLFGMLVAGLVIFFAVVRGGGAVGVRG